MHKTKSDPRLPQGADRKGDYANIPGEDFDGVLMHETCVRKVGNSLAIRIPSTVAKRFGLEDGSPVEMAVDDGTIYIRKAPSRTLAALIDRITPENMHEPVFEELIDRERW
jgi:antitoxin MazE